MLMATLEDMVTKSPSHGRNNEVTYDQFIARLDETGIEYALFRYGAAVYVEVGRYGYRFGQQGELSGGWIHNSAEDWEAEWQRWSAFLKEQI